MKAFCIVFAFALLGIAVGDIVPAQEYDGLMVIEANVLSYASEFRFEPQSKTLYVLTKLNHQTWLYQLSLEPFALNNEPFPDVVHPVDFISYAVGRGIYQGYPMMFAVGTTPYSGNDYTYSLQLEVIRQEQFSSIRTYWDYPNYILFNVAFDLGNDTSPTSSTFTAYFVGYTPESNSTSLQLSLVRTHVDIGKANPTISFTAEIDVLPLSYSGFISYDQHFKPWIFLDSVKSQIIVLTPGDNAELFRVYIPKNASLPMQLVSSKPISPPSHAIYDPLLGQIHVAFAGETFGQIVSYDEVLQAVNTFNFDLGERNPSGMAIDSAQSRLYVAINGLDYVISLDINMWTRMGSARLPSNFADTYSSFAYNGNIYFTTYEENSKVFSINQYNFCEELCPENGYCISGECRCRSPFVLAGRGCILPDQNSPSGESGAIRESNTAAAVLGVFFVLTLTAAVIGWAMFVRQRFGFEKRKDYIAI